MNFTFTGTAPAFFKIPGWLHTTVTDQSRNARAKVQPRESVMSCTRNQILEVKTPLGVTLECLRGRIWITLDGDSRDVVLDAGQTFTVDRDQRTLVMALDEATVRCTGPVAF